MLDCHRHHSNSAVGHDNSKRKNDNTQRENGNSRRPFDNTLRQQQQAKLKCMTTARSPEPTSSMRLVSGDFYFRESVRMT